MEIEAIGLSLRVALWAVACSLPPGILVAWLLSRRAFPGKVVVDALIHLPLVIPPVVTGYLLLILLGRRGVLGAWLWNTLGIRFAFNWKGAALAAAIMAFPLLVRAVRLSFDSVDRKLEEAARTLGSGRIRTFFTVTLPLAMPGVLTGAILAFARSLGEFGATITFVSNIPGETRTIPMAIYTLTQTPEGETGAFWLCAVAVAISLAALVASEVIKRRLDKRLRG